MSSATRWRCRDVTRAPARTSSSASEKQHAQAKNRHAQKKSAAARSRGARRARGNFAGKTFIMWPHDIIAQSLLPFIAWHDTSALACASAEWSIAVRSAREQCFEWKNVTCRGSSARACVEDLARRVGRSGCARLQFPPTMMLATVSIGDANRARQLSVLWKELIASLEREGALPLGCTVIALLNSHASGEEMLDCNVTVSLSMGHFPQTSIEVALFDRKELRWSANGLTEELASPFGDLGVDDNPTLMLFGSNTKAAQALLAHCAQWFPSVSVAGAVVGVSAQAAPLMLYQRTGRIEGKRKHRGRGRPRQDTSATSSGAVEFPSTALIRVRGNVTMKSFAMCLKQPLVKLVRCEGVVEMGDFGAPGRYRSYVVVSTDGRIGSTCSLADWLREREFPGGDDENGAKGRVTLFASKNAEALSSVIEADDARCCSSTLPSHFAGSIRHLTVYYGRHGAMTIDEHWEVGEYGLLCASLEGNPQTAQAKYDQIMRQLCDPLS